MMTLAPKMEDLQVARVYAQAVWQAGENQATRNEILEEVDGVIDVANSSDDIRSLLFSNTFGPNAEVRSSTRRLVVASIQW